MGQIIDFKKAKFSVGDVVHHRLFDYRGVIVDADPEFQLTDDWYDAVARSRPPKDKPWYHVLVDGASHSTYVAEQNLEPEPDPNPIAHPLVGEFFSRYENGHYVRDDWSN